MAPIPPIPPRPGRGPLFIDPEAKIKAALRGLGVDRAEARRCIFEMLGWLNAVTTADEVLQTMRQHPLQKRRLDPGPFGRVPLPRLPATKAKQVAAAVLAERGALGGQFDAIEQVAAVPAVDEVALAQLVQVGCELGAQLPPGPLVGVMLPLRIETRFFAPSPADPAWTMRLRIIPDAPSIDRHLTVPTAEELDALETMWVNANADLTTETGKAQWRRFTTQVGAARAAWLARTFPAQVSGGTITITRP
ncbi:MAG: hypothetical protein QOG69_2340, partial [Actinomycetota bacterium]|nr:hypothetical protein [Actinomycetota bacterium]